MLGHQPVPPQPHFPDALSPVIGYIATRQPQPLEDRAPVEREWWEVDDDEPEEWVSPHQRMIKVTAIVLSLSLLLAGLGTVVDVVLSSH
jgi:hypothetical protein